MTLFDYWQVIARRKWRIAAFCCGMSVAALIVSLLLPKIYESTATLLPQLESNNGLGLGAFLSTDAASSAAQSLGISIPGAPAASTDIFTAMLKSRIMADDIIRRFNLMEHYDKQTMQEARLALEAATRVVVSKEKVIKVTVEDKDPQLASDMANYYVSNLDRLNQTLSVSKARENRKFIEQRVMETKQGLVKLEDSLKEFQTRNRTVAIEAQSQAMIEAVAMIQAQIMSQEVQLQVMGTYLSPNNPEIARVQSSISELRKQLHMMESGKSGKEHLPGDRLRPAITSVPALALEYGRLTRDLKVHETLYALLLSQYEQAKLTEARDTPTVQVLDPAIPAERKSRPKVSLNVLIAGILSLLIGTFWAFFREAIDRRNAPPSSGASQLSSDESLLSPLPATFSSSSLSQLESYENTRT
ncbi:MAG TPA: GNVR domain-containing protein [Nitrospira sp.]|nr:GNVR domain-containing protein [Nitrospira sp.]